MNYFSEFIVCLVTFAVAEGVKPDIVVITGEDAVLPCAAKSKEGVQYRSVIWYKVAEGPSRTLTGLVMKRLTKNDGKVQKYKGVEREVELLESTKSLILSNVTAEDSGIYSCFLSAPLGHQNQEGKIVLNVNEWASIRKSSVMRLSTSTSGLNIICFIKPEEAHHCVRSSLGVIPGYCCYYD
ncbi:CD83 antigen [Anabarilius grahami]|uniref:CD83 antigen n=1 Tax=Anabarilius grahami TaxID=495550 RepID=A0A3N0XS50_ANAGA|nr:CD83 antigen [Anabarilius grahami]